jgi:AcrR family transcriptional regulator
VSGSQDGVGEKPTDDGSGRRDRYHHGDLRESLIGATQALLLEKGAEHFTLADACRRAGVTTAAPYKHFRDKQEILEIICQRGFDRLRATMHAAVEAQGPGTQLALRDMGISYVRFAHAEPNMFRLMFGQNADLKLANIVDEAGTGCFGYLIEQVGLYIARQGNNGDPRTQALRLWTFVHGAACLLIDGDYEKVAANLDVEALITNSTMQLLS